jgi:hypothetical protein
MPRLTKQEQKVYSFIKAHRGCTTRDIIHNTFITCPSARITEMRKKGVRIIEIGTVRYGDTQPFVKYAIEEPQKSVDDGGTSSFDF